MSTRCIRASIRLLIGFLVGSWLLAAAPVGAQAEIVAVDDTLFDFFHAPFNPGCPGCGLLDWDDLYNSGYACRRLPDGARGSLCTGLADPPDPNWDDATAISGSLEIRSELTNRFDGLVTEFDDPDDPFPPYDPSVGGAIQSLTGTYALRHTGHNGPVENAIEGHLLVKQGGDFYVSGHSVAAASGGGLGAWVRVGEAGGVPIVFTAADFGRVLIGAPPDMGQNPDFSESGAPLFFGFALDMSYEGPLGGLPGNPFLNRGFNVDDIEITLTTTTDPVPALAPAVFGLLCALLAAAGIAALRRAY
jgi:hypothetical protein